MQFGTQCNSWEAPVLSFELYGCVTIKGIWFYVPDSLSGLPRGNMTK